MQTTPSSRATAVYLLFVAFVSGAAIMTIEIAASRLLAPYFGASLFIWTNIIGVVLIALSVGYYVGGQLADRRPHPRLLFGIIAAAGIIGLAIPWMVHPVASYLTLDALVFQSGSFFIFVSSLAVTLFVFSVPLCLLGTVSPFIIKLYSAERHQVGESSGTVFAISTVGSILGTFLPTLWLIPTFGTRATITSAGAALVVVAAWGMVRSPMARVAAVLLLFASAQVAARGSTRMTMATLYEDESQYHYIRVEEAPDGTRVLLFNEGLGTQSYFHPDRVLSGGYFDYYATLPIFFENDRDLDVLIIGLAGGTISRQLSYFYGDRLHIDGVEIDKKVIDIGYQYFDLARSNLSVYNEDGIVYLMRSGKKYDIIIVDAYQQQLYIPWTMTTQEFWRLVTDRLSTDGIVAMNVAADVDSSLLRAIANTQSSIFQNVTVAGTGEYNLNTMIIASNRTADEMRLHEAESEEELRSLARGIVTEGKHITYDQGEAILTNDKAPIEFMTDQMVFNVRKD